MYQADRSADGEAVADVPKSKMDKVFVRTHTSDTDAEAEDRSMSDHESSSLLRQEWEFFQSTGLPLHQAIRFEAYRQRIHEITKGTKAGKTFPDSHIREKLPKLISTG